MNENKKIVLSITYYPRGNQNNWYADFYAYDKFTIKEGTKKAGGYGYDKMSTCVSNALNEFNTYFTRYSKKAKKYTSYGLYEDNTISYGIGYGAVRGCLKCFKNVKIVREYFGKYENNLTIEIGGCNL